MGEKLLFCRQGGTRVQETHCFSTSAYSIRIKVHHCYKQKLDVLWTTMSAIHQEEHAQGGTARQSSRTIAAQLPTSTGVWKTHRTLFTQDLLPILPISQHISQEQRQEAEEVLASRNLPLPSLFRDPRALFSVAASPSPAGWRAGSTCQQKSLGSCLKPPVSQVTWNSPQPFSPHINKH